MTSNRFVRWAVAVATRIAGALRRVFKRVTATGSGPFFAGC
jgi:hypothetical protein